mmetsp:Transcript_24904/g.27481  ORF Transcript_24904/g.27481 Transcript_24904/m.27481 type:complete len:155 (+) Transcript_24904:170-634(+)
MVYYELVMTAKNMTPFHELTSLVKTISHRVVENGGIVRTIRNHGIRDLPHRFKTKYPDAEGHRYFKKGRFISVYYDASPYTQNLVEYDLRLNTNVLRMTHLKVRNPMWYVNIMREDKNPYIQKVLRQEALTAAEEEAREREEEVEANEEEGEDL